MARRVGHGGSSAFVSDEAENYSIVANRDSLDNRDRRGREVANQAVSNPA